MWVLSSFTNNHYTAVQQLWNCCRKLSEIRANRWLLWHSDFTKFNFCRGFAPTRWGRGLKTLPGPSSLAPCRTDIYSNRTCQYIATDDANSNSWLQITQCLPLFSSTRASPPFGWYSFYRPTEGRRLSRPGWLVTYRNKVPPPGVEPGQGHPSQ